MLSSSGYESHRPDRFAAWRVGEPRSVVPVPEDASTRLLRGYASRCAARAKFGGECVSDREWNLQADEVFCQAIPDGTLAKVRRGSSWVLFLEWSEGYGRRLLTHGSREQVERYALDVAAHGPPGGPEFRGEETVWRRSCDGTLHTPTVGGEFRLMPLVGGKHLLIFARNDGGMSVLGVGDAEDLQSTADDRLHEHRGGAITLDVGYERISLRGITAAGVLGYVDSFDGARLLLGHLAGEQFGLFYVRGQTGHCIRRYDLAALRRGDLGRLVYWEGHERRGAGGEAEVHAEPPGAREARPGARTRGFPEPEEALARPVGRRSLSPAELSLLDRHLSPEGAVTGPGATIVPRLLAGLRALVRLGLPNQQLRACEVRALFATRASIEVQACSKTFGRALAAVAAHTRIIRRDGRRWLICLGDLLLADSELMRWIAVVAPVGEADFDGRPSSDVGDGLLEAAISATAREPIQDSKAVADDSAYQARPSSEGDLEAGASSQYSDREEPAGDGADPVGQSMSAYQRYRLRLRRDGPLQVTMASVPIEESASRGQFRKKVRDPP